MYRYLAFAVFSFTLIACQKNTTTTIDRPENDVTKPDSSYFIYQGLENVKVTELPGYPRKSFLKTYANSKSLHGRDSILLNLIPEQTAHITILREFKYLNINQSASKHGQSIEVSIKIKGGFKIALDSLPAGFDKTNFLLSAIEPGDLINLHQTQNSDFTKAYYCLDRAVNIPLTCHPTYPKSRWHKGKPGSFICWNDRDSEKSAFLINMQTPTIDSLIVHSVKKIEF